MTKKFVAGELALKRPSLSLQPEDVIGQSEFLNPRRHSGAAAVIERGRLVGILTERDLLKRVLARGFDPNATRVKDVMSPNPAIIPHDSDLKTTLQIMTQSGFRYLPVMNNYSFVGMIDVRDLYIEIQNLMENALNTQYALFSGMVSEPYGGDIFAIRQNYPFR